MGKVTRVVASWRRDEAWKFRLTRSRWSLNFGSRHRRLRNNGLLLMPLYFTLPGSFAGRSSSSSTYLLNEHRDTRVSQERLQAVIYIEQKDKIKIIWNGLWFIGVKM